MYIYHALINTLSAHMIHINLNYTLFCTHIQHSPTKTIYTRYYMETCTQTHKGIIWKHAHTHTHAHTDWSTNWVLILIVVEIL